MKNQFKIIISSKNLYKEIELNSEDDVVIVGTDIECDVRLKKQLFFDSIKLNFTQENEGWRVTCSDNLFISLGDIRKLLTMKLTHGDVFEIKYQNSNSAAFRVEFLVDFDYDDHKFERIIDISGKSDFTFGTDSSNDVILESDYIVDDQLVFSRNKTELQVNILKTTYGVHHNGEKVKEHMILKSGDFFSISELLFFYKGNMIWSECNEKINVREFKTYDFPSNGKYPKFNRNTRVKNVIIEDEIEILDPPAKPTEAKRNIVTRLLPAMGMLLAAGAMAYIGGRMIVFSAISAGMAIITTIISVREGKKEFRKKTIERVEKYKEYISLKRMEIEEIRMLEKKCLDEIFISIQEEEKRIRAFSSDLFDRVLEDDDFLCVRLGTGSVDANRKINIKQQEQLEVADDLQKIPEQLLNEYKKIKEAPVFCDLKKCNGMGITGSEESRFALLKNIVLDLATRHYPSDLKLLFVSEEKHVDQIYRFRQLPHVFNENIGVRNIICDDDSKNVIFEYLYRELVLREENKLFVDRIVVIFYDEYGFNSHPISKYLDKASDLGVTFIFLAENNKDLPLNCAYIASLSSDIKGLLIDTSNKNNGVDFSFKGITNKRIDSLIQILAPIYSEEISLESDLTKSFSLFEMLEILDVEDLDLCKRWTTSDIVKTMKSPIGISKNGLIELDLHDSAHGPHGLVAGTTGSGKSEILQTYILAMSTLYHPYEVGFLIIDFKGGGMVNQFKDIPHLLGTITNIDGKEINRSLKSIKAELQKRQRLFAEANVNHIDKYIKKYKDKEVSEALPHLIIIVDEFAELKADQPEFMKELISAARIGRSLGVHLILATQKPSGQVSEQIWSNSRFKLCLKVQSKEDSNEVLKSPLAAEIKEPGRTYLQVGNNEIFELFQSAYSGAPQMVEDSKTKEFSIYEMTESAKKIPVYVQKKEDEGEENNTQLEAVVQYISKYCKAQNIMRLSSICLQALEKVISFPSISSMENADLNIIANIGIYDAPEKQYQGEYSINLSEHNVMIIGSSQSGKTNLLQTIIRSITSKYSPDEVNIYGIDFASMILKNYEDLNHVGGIVTHSEDEKLKNLFKLLNTEIKVRKEKLLSIGVSSFLAYKEAGKTDLPQIVLIIDNLTALKETYFQDSDELLNICREGIAVGVSIVIANSQTAGIGYKYLSNFASRIALYCNDTNEYNSIFDYCSMRIDDISGRAIVEIEKKHLECQTYIAFEGEKEIARVEQIKKYIGENKRKNVNQKAKVIPIIPTLLTEEYVSSSFSSYLRNKFEVIVGLDYENVSPLVFDLSQLGVMAIAGKEQSGKHNFVKYLMKTFKEQNKDQVKMFILDDINRKYDDYKDMKNVYRYTMLPEEACSIIFEVEKELEMRYQSLIKGDADVIQNSDLLFVVIENQDALIAINNNKEAFLAYKNIVGRYKKLNVCILISKFENQNIPYGAAEIIKNIRDEKHFLYFDNIQNMKIFDLPLVLTRKYKKPIEVGDCYYIKENKCVKIKSVFCKE